MGFETRNATGQTGPDRPPWPGSARHDMRPALDAVVTRGLLTPGTDLGGTGDHALLLVPLDGDPFGIRLGEGMAEPVEMARGGAVVVAAHTAVRMDLSAPVGAILIEFGEALMRSSPVPVFGRRRGHHALRSGAATHLEGIVGAASLLARDMETNVGGFAFRSALTLAIIEGIAHDDAFVRHREEVASDYTLAGIERALRLIEQDLSAPLSLDVLAAEAGISAYHLSRSFRRITGTNLHAYMRQRRLQEACRLLSETRRPLVQIAYDCGFSSQSRMTTVFRQLLDTTPLAYRQQCWRAGEDAGGGRAAGAPRPRSMQDR